MKPRSFSKVAVTAVLALGVLGACRAEEQGRLTNYEPGVYKGKPDTQLGEIQRRQLRQRSNYQGSKVSSGGGGPVAPAAKASGTATATGIDLGQLRNRGRMQGGSGARL